ncbi:MAG: RagB/SusD family nutrient uptake outer membrane protein, partial [Bacteroidaceae bacterium]|nr:RagB/SusD family nutrient uptake outer membrane protein [Bacteroidaceae bacterium]
MKKLYIAAVAVISLSACTNDLDVEPLDPTVSTANRVYGDAANYQKALDKIYSVWALSGQDGAGGSDISDLDAGNTVLFRSWFTLQTQTTDEMKNSWSDPWCLDVNGIMWGTTKNEPVEGVYQRCMFIVALANEFLKNIPNAPEEVDKTRFAAEARFCRALAYYTLLDMFGIPPFITEENYSINPSQL